MHRHVVFLTVAALILGPAATSRANGLGEGRAVQFRSPSERQVLANVETLRLQQAGEYKVGTGVGGSSGLGTSVGGQPTGNVLSVTVSGTNNVLNLDLTQDNTGNQTSDNTLNGTLPNQGGGGQ